VIEDTLQKLGVVVEQSAHETAGRMDNLNAHGQQGRLVEE